jgi:hypothetical protein
VVRCENSSGNQFKGISGQQNDAEMENNARLLRSPQTVQKIKKAYPTLVTF